MSFFDDKQEILKIELTTYGRYLISRGKFQPVYYAFFDDDILYDSEYANLSESQNSVQTRILEQTPSLKPQTTFTSIENSVKLNTLLPREIGKLKEESQQISADKNYALCYPLANSAHSSEYAPAWNINFLKGKLSGSIQEFINNASGNYEILQPFLKLPQMNLEENIYLINRSKNDTKLQNSFKQIYTYISGNDQYTYSMREEPIIIDFREINVDDNLKNFDIELFIEEEELIPGTEEKRKVLNKLNFKKDPITILNGILLDQPLTFDILEDPTFSEYYFEITVDDEIESPEISDVGRAPNIQAGGIYSQNSNALTGISKNKGPFGVDC